MAPTHVFPLPLYLRTGTGACPYDCVRLRLPSPVLPLPSPVLYLRTGTGACPYDCVRLRLPSPVSRLPLFPLIPSSIP